MCIKSFATIQLCCAHILFFFFTLSPIYLLAKNLKNLENGSFCVYNTHTHIVYTYETQSHLFRIFTTQNGQMLAKKRLNNKNRCIFFARLFVRLLLVCIYSARHKMTKTFITPKPGIMQMLPLLSILANKLNKCVVKEATIQTKWHMAMGYTYSTNFSSNWFGCYGCVIVIVIFCALLSALTNKHDTNMGKQQQTHTHAYTRQSSISSKSELCCFSFRHAQLEQMYNVQMGMSMNMPTDNTKNNNCNQNITKQRQFWT